MRSNVVAAITAALSLLAAAPALGGGSLADYRQLFLDGRPVKWGEPALGTGAVVTYALADTPVAFDVRRFASAENCAGIVPVDQLAATSAVPVATLRSELAAAFAAWGAVADVTFREADPAKADILIGAEAVPRGYAFTNLVAVSPPGAKAGPERIERAVICLNPAERWKVGFDGDLAVYDLRYTLLHEIGHAIGLDHPAAPGAVMYFRYSELFRTLQPGDIAGAVALYGPNRALVAKAPVGAAPTAVPPPSDGAALGIGARAR